MRDLYLTVASWDDRDDLVTELTVEDGDETEDWGLVTFDPASNTPILELYPRADGGDWRFELDEVQAILTKARRRIVEVAGPLPAEESSTLEPDEDGSAVARVEAGDAQEAVATGAGHSSFGR